jgi:hypothetical protein
MIVEAVNISLRHFTSNLHKYIHQMLYNIQWHVQCPDTDNTRTNEGDFCALSMSGCSKFSWEVVSG